MGIGIAVAAAGGTGVAFVRFPNTSDGPPEIPKIFGIPGGNPSVRHRDVYMGKETRQLNCLQVGVIADLESDLIIETRRSAKTRDAIVRPKNCHKGLVLC